jgi:hypothetical protein
MQIERIMSELSAAEGLPEAAIRAAIERPEQSVPAFLAAIEVATAGKGEDEDSAAIFFIFHILGELGAHEAYRPLARLLQLPPERLDALLGDGLAETGIRVMAQIFDGDPAPLQEVIENPAADEMARAQMLETLAVLARLGRWDRAAAESYLHGLTMRLQPRAQSFVWVGFAEAVAMLGMRELRPFIQQLHERDWIDPMVCDLDDFDSDLEATMDDPDGPPLVWGRPFEPWTDTIGELRGWHGFADEPEEESEGDDLGTLFEASEPRINPWRDIGRNDPCPCGSGRKFKKCCLPRIEAEGLL